MNNGFDWVPFFEEMAQKLVAYRERQPLLVEILQESGVNGLADQNSEGITIALAEIDPFTFIAMLNKQSHLQRMNALTTVKSRLGIISPVPSGFDGVPKADPRQTWLFPYQFERKADDISKLWDLFEVVLSDKKISEEVFAAARSVKYAGKAKLTQAIFRVAPSRFFPVDGQTTSYLARLRLPYTFSSAEEFQSICAQVAERVEKPLFEQSYDAWYFNQQRNNNDEAQYQTQVLRKAVQTKKFVEKTGGVALPNRSTSGSTGGGYTRNANVAAEALRLADFKCEVDSQHITFISNAKEKPYVEAHHLIPFGSQDCFKFSLDVTANIVALCPNCHRRLHHGRKLDKAKEIATLFEKRKSRLVEKELRISLGELMMMYKGDLLEEDA
jgi:5-methylcytosine-specific restriction protein A